MVRRRVDDVGGERVRIAEVRSRKSVPDLIKRTPWSASVPAASRWPGYPSQDFAPLPIWTDEDLVSARVTLPGLLSTHIIDLPPIS